MKPCPSDLKLDKNSIKRVIILNLTFAPKSRSEALHLNIAIYHYIYIQRKKVRYPGTLNGSPVAVSKFSTKNPW